MPSFPRHLFDPHPGTPPKGAFECALQLAQAHAYDLLGQGPDNMVHVLALDRRHTPSVGFVAQVHPQYGRTELQGYDPASAERACDALSAKLIVALRAKPRQEPPP